MGAHSREVPEGDPQMTAPAGWLDAAEGSPEVREVASAFWGVAEDFADDRQVGEASRDRLVRALRTLAQGVGAAVLTGAVPVTLAAVKGDPTNVTAAASAFGTAALAAVLSYFHTRK